jgi:DinB superfamily
MSACPDSYRDRRRLVQSSGFDRLNLTINCFYMKEVVRELREIVEAFSKRIAEIPEAEFSAKPLPTKWSKKEVLGHLIDSAENNLRRFICGQYETTPPKIRYEQEFWVNANDYRNAPSADVLAHWKLINLRICRVLDTMPVENYSKNCDTGKNEPNLHSIQWLAIDYVKHLKHHLNQIIPASFNITYP